MSSFAKAAAVATPPGIQFLERQSPNGAEFDFDLSGVSADYKHLRMVLSGRLAAGASSVVGIEIRCNGDAGTNYSVNYLRGLNSVASAGVLGSHTGAQILVPDPAANASLFALVLIDIPHWRDTTKFKHLRCQQSCFYNVAAGTVNEYSEIRDCIWENTAAINRLHSNTPAGNWVSGTTVDLYGIR